MGDDLEAIARGRHPRPHDVLGCHDDGRGARVVAYHPDAVAARLLPDGPALEPTGTAGLFRHDEAEITPEDVLVIEWTLDDGRTLERVEPWSFPPDTHPDARRAFHEGRHTAAWQLLGAHARERRGHAGVRFTAWAPSARQVRVVGDFNAWDGRTHPMTRHEGGIWELFVPGAGPGDRYQFEIRSAEGGTLRKTDPFARYTEVRPDVAALVLPETVYAWSDSRWLEQRPDWQRAPLSCYEVHLGSWLRHPDGRFYGYRELGRRLADHVEALGFTHVELLPVAEHPLDASWGYQGTGWFAPTRRFGAPDDFRALVDTLHRRGIGVVLDWVPGHFPRDPHGLASFDGTPLFEPADVRRAHMPDWGTLAFDHGRPEVRSFLISSAMYWLREFHVDGLRVDAVASMLYLDYGRKPGEWLPNPQGGRENLDAVAFLQRLNETTHGECPGTFTIAEESTAWPGVTLPTDAGGLGFSMKWNMGWMHDTLAYLKHEPVHRRHHHDHLTFGILYAFSENFVLPLSHDEVVHLKGSLLGRMPGDDWQRFANLRLLYAWQFTYPGKKLLFMGGEIGSPEEWDHDREPPWHLVEQPLHGTMQRWVGDLARAYRSIPALHERDFEAGGFHWIDCDDASQSLIAYQRVGADGRAAVVVLNFTPVPRHGHRIGLPHAGHWRERLNSDSEHYGGSGQGNLGVVAAGSARWKGMPYSATLTVPPLGALLLLPDPDDAD